MEPVVADDRTTSSNTNRSHSSGPHSHTNIKYLVYFPLFFLNFNYNYSHLNALNYINNYLRLYFVV